MSKYFTFIVCLVVILSLTLVESKGAAGNNNLSKLGDSVADALYGIVNAVKDIFDINVLIEYTRTLLNKYGSVIENIGEKAFQAPLKIPTNR